MRVKTLVILLSSILLVAVVAFSQGRMIASAKIPFAFAVESKVLPAGEYEFRDSSDGTAITVKSLDGKVVAFAQVVTRLAAAIHTTPQDSHIVFDKVGDTYTLAELWVPGDDGFMLHITKGKHEHRILDAPK